jgi:hypothetical protein
MLRHGRWRGLLGMTTLSFDQTNDVMLSSRL